MIFSMSDWLKQAVYLYINLSLIACITQNKLYPQYGETMPQRHFVVVIALSTCWSLDKSSNHKTLMHNMYIQAKRIYRGKNDFINTTHAIHLTKTCTRLLSQSRICPSYSQFEPSHKSAYKLGPIEKRLHNGPLIRYENAGNVSIGNR